jgi:hypothetical protein
MGRFPGNIENSRMAYILGVLGSRLEVALSTGRLIRLRQNFSWKGINPTGNRKKQQSVENIHALDLPYVIFLGQDRANAFFDLSLSDDTSPKSSMDSFDPSHPNYIFST